VVRLGSMDLRLQLISALLDRKHGQPGGTIFNGRPDDSCYNENAEFLINLNVPECWTCELDGGTRKFGFGSGDHVWVTCKAKDCAGAAVDTLILDYWSGSDSTISSGFPGPPPAFPFTPPPNVGPRPPCDPKWRGR
jgi:hypothetical protein